MKDIVLNVQNSYQFIETYMINIYRKKFQILSVNKWFKNNRKIFEILLCWENAIINI